MPTKAGSWEVWLAQYPESAWLLGALVVAGAAFAGLFYWLIFGLQPLPEEEEAAEAREGEPDALKEAKKSR